MKLSPWTIYVIGISAATLPIAFGFFHEWIPKNAEADATEKVIEDEKTTAGQYNQAKKTVTEAIQKANAQAAEWRYLAATRTPPQSVSGGGIDLAQNAYQLSVDTRIFRNNIQIAVNNQLKKGGIKVLTGPTVAGISEDTSVSTILTTFYNFPQPYPFPVVIRDLGSVQVEGTYNQIMANVRSWASMPHYLAVADGLRLDGTSPLLRGTYNVTIVGFIRADKVFPTVPEMGATAAGGGGGARGGPMGGMGGSPFGPGGPPPGMFGGGGPPGMPPGMAPGMGGGTSGGSRRGGG